MSDSKEVSARLSDTHLWDYFSISATGFIFVLNLIIIINYVFDVNLEKYFKSLDQISFVVYILAFYAIGLLVNAIFSFLYDLFRNRYKKGFFLDLHELKDKEKLQKDAINKRSDSNEKDKQFANIKERDAMTIARHTLELRNVPHRYMSFYSKHGFYKNLSILAFLNFVMFFYLFVDNLIRCRFDFAILLIGIATLLLHFFLYDESQKFWFYASDELFGKFLKLKIDHPN